MTSDDKSVVYAYHGSEWVGTRIPNLKTQEDGYTVLIRTDAGTGLLFSYSGQNLSSLTAGDVLSSKLTRYLGTFDTRSHAKTSFDPIPDAIAAIKRGEFVIVVDDEDRENEGDLIMAAEDMSPSKMAFLIRYSTGIICTPLLEDRARELDLPLMVQQNTESHQTAFTVSVDARKGVSTGVSAHDRSETVRLLARSETKPEQLARPGHVFPLIAKNGGVCERAGHTEAAVELCRLAGKVEVGVISEIAMESGEMARRDDLLLFATRFNLCIITIQQLIQHLNPHYYQ